MRLRVMLRVSTINSHWEFLDQKNENLRDMSGRRSSFSPRYDARARTSHNTTQNRSRKISCTYSTVIVFWQWSNGGSVSFFRFSFLNLFSRRVFLLHILSVVTLFMNFGWVCAVRFFFCTLRAILTFYLWAPWVPLKMCKRSICRMNFDARKPPRNNRLNAFDDWPFPRCACQVNGCFFVWMNFPWHQINERRRTVNK